MAEVKSAQIGHRRRLARSSYGGLAAKLELGRRQRREVREVVPLGGGQPSSLMVEDAQDAGFGVAKRHAGGESAGVGGGKLPRVQLEERKLGGSQLAHQDLDHGRQSNGEPGPRDQALLIPFGDGYYRHRRPQHTGCKPCQLRELRLRSGALRACGGASRLLFCRQVYGAHFSTPSATSVVECTYHCRSQLSRLFACAEVRSGIAAASRRGRELAAR